MPAGLMVLGGKSLMTFTLRFTLREGYNIEILDQQFPELANIEPIVKTGPAESQLRTLRRRRTPITQADIRAIPIEYQFIYRRTEDDAYPFDRTVEVATNDKGETKFIIESK